MVRKTTKHKVFKFEKLTYSLVIICLVSLPLTTLFFKANLSKYNFEVETLKKEVVKQQNKNESLHMKISELASLEKVDEIAKALGLVYNNGNIKNIGD